MLTVIERASIAAEINRAMQGRRYARHGIVAAKIKEIAQPLCGRVSIVGSLRRGNPDPDDVDLLVIADLKDVCYRLMSAFEQVADGGDVGWDGRHMRFSIAVRNSSDEYGGEMGTLPCHIILSNEVTWGMDLLNYTGSRGFNNLWIERAKRRGYDVDGGFIGHKKKDPNDSYKVLLIRAMDNKSEEEILEHLGLSVFADPALRDFE